jgi:hypothetical protein
VNTVKLRISDGTDIGDYLDYLFGRTERKENHPEKTRRLCEKGQEKEGEEGSMGNMLEIDRNKKKKKWWVDEGEVADCKYEKGYFCMKPFMSPAGCSCEDSVSKACCCKGK